MLGTRVHETDIQDVLERYGYQLRGIIEETKDSVALICTPVGEPELAFTVHIGRGGYFNPDYQFVVPEDEEERKALAGTIAVAVERHSSLVTHAETQKITEEIAKLFESFGHSTAQGVRIPTWVGRVEKEKKEVEIPLPPLDRPVLVTDESLSKTVIGATISGNTAGKGLEILSQGTLPYIWNLTGAPTPLYDLLGKWLEALVGREKYETIRVTTRREVDADRLMDDARIVFTHLSNTAFAVRDKSLTEQAEALCKALEELRAGGEFKTLVRSVLEKYKTGTLFTEEGALTPLGEEFVSLVGRLAGLTSRQVKTDWATYKASTVQFCVELLAERVLAGIKGAELPYLTADEIAGVYSLADLSGLLGIGYNRSRAAKDDVAARIYENTRNFVFGLIKLQETLRAKRDPSELKSDLTALRMSNVFRADANSSLHEKLLSEFSFLEEAFREYERARREARKVPEVEEEKREEAGLRELLRLLRVSASIETLSPGARQEIRDTLQRVVDLCTDPVLKDKGNKLLEEMREKENSLASSLASKLEGAVLLPGEFETQLVSVLKGEVPVQTFVRDLAEHVAREVRPLLFELEREREMVSLYTTRVLEFVAEAQGKVPEET